MQEINWMCYFKQLDWMFYNWLRKTLNYYICLAEISLGNNQRLEKSSLAICAAGWNFFYLFFKSSKNNFDANFWCYFKHLQRVLLSYLNHCLSSCLLSWLRFWLRVSFRSDWLNFLNFEIVSSPTISSMKIFPILSKTKIIYLAYLYLIIILRGRFFFREEDFQN